MVVQVRLDVPIEPRNGNGPPKVTEADTAARNIAQTMGVTVSRVKVREDVVQLYGTKVA